MARNKDLPPAFVEFGSPDNGTPVHQQASTPASQYTSKPVKQDTSKPALKKFTYYLTVEQDNKLEDIRSARRKRGIHVDKSALVREAIDLLQESDAPPVAQPAPVEQKHVEVEAQPVPGDLVSLQEFADLHAINRNEAERLWKTGMIAGTRQSPTSTRYHGKNWPVMLGAKGRSDFYAQFHDMQGFRACDDCPHSR